MKKFYCQLKMLVWLKHMNDYDWEDEKRKENAKCKMKIVGNKIDLLFLLYIQQKVFSQHKKDIVSFLLEKGIGQRKAQGLIFLLESIVFEENEKEYSMLSLKQKEDDYDTNELSITEWGFVIPPIIKVNNCIVEK